jgi:hypothetical protein
MATVKGASRSLVLLLLLVVVLVLVVSVVSSFTAAADDDDDDDVRLIRFRCFPEEEVKEEEQKRLFKAR